MQVELSLNRNHKIGHVIVEDRKGLHLFYFTH